MNKFIWEIKATHVDPMYYTHLILSRVLHRFEKRNALTPETLVDDNDDNNNNEQKRQKTAENDAKKLSVKDCGLSRAEIVDTKKFLGKILRNGQTMDDAFDSGEKLFAHLKPKAKYISRVNANYMGFAEDDKAKIMQLWKNGHQSLAVAFLILKVLLFVG